MQTIVLATGNPGKVNELSTLLADQQITIVPQSQFDVPEVAETGSTFVENAIIKARHAAQISGLPAIADDSGLEVDYLLGAPGIYSARYAGESASDHDNMVKLLHALKDVPKAQRRARFQCVLVYLRHALDPTPIICQGTWHGEICEQAMGEQGFGYDPIFWLEPLQQTSAQLPRALKNQLSHRAQALAQLVTQLAHEQK
jgi:XTP/dITP diphosphohydrolase